MKAKHIVTTAGIFLGLMAPVQAAEDSNAAYSEGFSLILQQQWQQARDYFTRFAAEWPDSDMQDDAGYWRCFSWERSQNASEDQFACYQDFVGQWPNSNWLDDARERMMILGGRLAEQGQPQFLGQAFDDYDYDFNFDFDFEEIRRIATAQGQRAAEQGQRAAAQAQRVIQTMREARELDEVLVLVDGNRSFGVSGNRRNIDPALLAVLSALKDDPRAGELLIKYFRESDDADVRARMVLMMEDFDTPEVNEFLREVAENDASEDVRNNAVMMLLDRNDAGISELMHRVITSEAYPMSMRTAVLRTVGRWDSSNAISTFNAIISSGADRRLVAAAAQGLMNLRSPEGYQALTVAYRDISDPELRYAVLDVMDGRGASELLGLLTEVALAADDRAAGIAIDNIANLENEMAVSTLQHIYFNTSSEQRHLAVIHGLGEAESSQAVEFLIEVVEQQSSPEIQISIVRALGNSEQASAIEPVMNLYRNTPDGELKNETVRALRQLDDHAQARDYLLEILEDQLDAATTR